MKSLSIVVLACLQVLSHWLVSPHEPDEQAAYDPSWEYVSEVDGALFQLFQDTVVKARMTPVGLRTDSGEYACANPSTITIPCQRSLGRLPVLPYPYDRSGKVRSRSFRSELHREEIREAIAEQVAEELSDEDIGILYSAYRRALSSDPIDEEILRACILISQTRASVWDTEEVHAFHRRAFEAVTEGREAYTSTRLEIADWLATTLIRAGDDSALSVVKALLDPDYIGTGARRMSELEFDRFFNTIIRRVGATVDIYAEDRRKFADSIERLVEANESYLEAYADEFADRVVIRRYRAGLDILKGEVIRWRE